MNYRPGKFFGVLVLSAAIGASFVPVAAAQSSFDHISDLLEESGSAGLGFITRIETSPYKGGGSRQDLLPLYLYEGDRFFLNADRAGFKFVDDDTQRWDAFVTRRLEGFPEDERTESLEGMEVRNTGADVGVSYEYRQSWGKVRAIVLHDVTGVSEGNELRLGYSYEWRSDRWVLWPDFSVSFRDSHLNNYYYGVKPEEATPERPAYRPGSGLNATAGLYGSYAILESWRLLGGLSITWLDSGIRDSPIIRDKLQPALYLGAVYDFGNRRATWENDDALTYVKVFYGRASGPGCHMVNIMTLRCTSLDHENPTSVTGVHMGKPFIERLNGWPVDFNGYIGLLYRDDNGLQTNGLQVDMYMKGFYYGFPWSRWVKTRIGMGYGISYAQHVPYTEVSSQARRERPTSKLLNYLDPTIDVNVGDIFRAENLKNTYFGLGISHRSGIFGSSRLLGNVNGGSNYIYAYVESGF